MHIIPTYKRPKIIKTNILKKTVLIVFKTLVDRRGVFFPTVPPKSRESRKCRPISLASVEAGNQKCNVSTAN
uniref:Uncharacterized protein n=1 Tax=Cannabis sativa TaxID=3483 RepID=A0A803RC60_CANSA